MEIRAIVDGEADLIGGNFLVVNQLTWRRLYSVYLITKLPYHAIKGLTPIKFEAEYCWNICVTALEYSVRYFEVKFMYMKTPWVTRILDPLTTCMIYFSAYKMQPFSLATKESYIQTDARLNGIRLPILILRQLQIENTKQHYKFKSA